MKSSLGDFLVACFLLVAASLSLPGNQKPLIYEFAAKTITVQEISFSGSSNFTQQGGVDRGVVT